MTRNKVLLLLGLLICCVATAAFISNSATKQNARKHTPYTIVWKAVDHYGNGRETEAYTETRFIASNGNWRSIIQLPDGHTVEKIGEVGRGVFVVDRNAQRLQFLSPLSEKDINRQTARQSIRTDKVLDYTVNVYANNSVQDKKFVELFRAPDLDGDVIKQIFHNDGYSRVIEPQSITLGEPSPESLAHKEYPIDDSFFKNSKAKNRQQSLDQIPTQGRLAWYAEQAKARGEQQIIIPAPTVDYDGSSFSTGINEALSYYGAIVVQLIDQRSVAHSSNDIVTWYKFKVTETLSQQSAPCSGCLYLKAPEELLPLNKDEILVSEVGGTLSIDGVLVTMTSGGFPPFQQGKKYLLLISRDSSGVAMVGGGSIGVFNIGEDGILEPIDKEHPHPIKQGVQEHFGNSLDKLRGHLKDRPALR